MRQPCRASQRIRHFRSLSRRRFPRRFRSRGSSAAINGHAVAADGRPRRTQPARSSTCWGATRDRRMVAGRELRRELPGPNRRRNSTRRIRIGRASGRFQRGRSRRYWWPGIDRPAPCKSPCSRAPTMSPTDGRTNRARGCGRCSSAISTATDWMIFCSPIGRKALEAASRTAIVSRRNRGEHATAMPTNRNGWWAISTATVEGSRRASHRGRLRVAIVRRDLVAEDWQSWNKLDAGSRLHTGDFNGDGRIDLGHARRARPAIGPRHCPPTVASNSAILDHWPAKRGWIEICVGRFQWRWPRRHCRARSRRPVRFALAARRDDRSKSGRSHSACRIAHLVAGDFNGDGRRTWPVRSPVRSDLDRLQPKSRRFAGRIWRLVEHRRHRSHEARQFLAVGPRHAMPDKGIPVVARSCLPLRIESLQTGWLSIY